MIVKLQIGQRWHYTYGEEDYICEVLSIQDTAVEVIVVQHFKGEYPFLGRKYVFWTEHPGELPEDCGSYRYLHQQDKPK